MPEQTRTPNVRKINRTSARAARQSWGAFTTSVIGGHIYVLIYTSRSSPEPQHAVAIPARWLPEYEDVKVTSSGSFDCQYGLNKVIPRSAESEGTGQLEVTLVTHHGTPTIAVVPIEVATRIETTRGRLSRSELLDAKKLTVVDPTDNDS